MRSTKFYPTKLVSSFVLLLLFMNVFSAFAQDPGPNITKPTTCIDHNPGTVGSIYTYTYTGAGASPVWTVRGDIQLLDANNNPVGSLAGTTAKIRSTANYGKGRLIVTFNQIGCGAQREYVDVYKVFSLLDEWPASNPDNSILNNIVGPRCVTAGAKLTYSINSVLSRNLGQEIGIDQYRWVYPAGWTRTYISGDSSSVTFIATSVSSTDSLKVFVGKCNPVPYSIKLYNAVPVPVINPIACVPTSTTGTSQLTLSVNNPSADYEYNWFMAGNSNWYVTDGISTNKTQVTLTIDNTTNYVTVQAVRKNATGSSDCDMTESARFWIRRTLPAGSTISGPACVDGSKFNTYTLNGATGDFKWTFTPNAGGTGHGFSAANPSGPSVSFKAGTMGGVLSVVSADPTCGNPVTLNITASTARPSVMTGSFCVNPGATNLGYTVDPVPGATSYTWTLSGTLTSTSTLINGSNTITVNAGSSGGNISVVANNGTCPSQPLLKTVSLNPVAPTSVTASQFCINRSTADEIVFTAATPVAGQTYEWQVIYPTGVTTGWTVKGTTTNGSTVTATTGNSITYVTNGTVGSYRVEARAVRTGCSFTGWVSSATVATGRSISVNKMAITDNDTGEQIGDLLIASSIPLTNGVTSVSYRWTRTSSTGVTTVLPETGSTLDLSIAGDGSAANYCVVATINGAVNGCTTNSACVTTTYNPSTAARLSSGQKSPELLSSQVVVYPNPTSSGEFTLQLPAFKGQAGVVLKNLQGQVVYKTEVSKTKSKLSAGKLTSGVYLLQVSLEGKVVTKKVTVKK